MEFIPTVKNFQETEEDSTSFGNSTGDTEWEQYPFYPAIDNLMGSEDASFENSISPQDGSFSEKDDDFVFDFTEEAIEVCYYRKERYISGRRKMKGAKASQNKKRNVLLEAWGCIRKLFLKFLECKSSLEIMKTSFSENSELWENQFGIYRKFFTKVANRIPRNKFSLGFLDSENSEDPYIYTFNRVLRILFTSFINEKAELYINRLEMISGTMKEILIEMITLYKKSVNKRKY